MNFSPITRQLILKNSIPENVIVALPNTYFYRSGNDDFYLVANEVKKRIEVRKKSFILPYDYKTEMWFHKLTEMDIAFEQTHELWLKKGQGYNSKGWEFVSFKAYSFDYPTPTPTISITPTISLTPSVSATPTVTPTVSSTASPTPTVTPTPTYTSTATPTPTLTVTPSSTPPDQGMISAAFSSSYGIVGVWANKYKVENYSGPLWKIRRSSDNAEQDCYSVSDVNTFIGAGTAYVRTWYDQSGQGRHFTQTNTSYQPTLYFDNLLFGSTTVYMPAGTGMVGTYNDSGNANATYAVSYLRVGSGYRVLAGSNNWLVGPYSDRWNLFATTFAAGPTSNTLDPKVNAAWKSNSGQYYLRVDSTDVGIAAGSTNPGTIGLGREGAFNESALSRVQGIIFAKPTSTNTTSSVYAIEQKLFIDIRPSTESLSVDNFDSYSLGNITSLNSGSGWYSSGYFTSSFYFTGSDDFELYRTGSIDTLSSGGLYWSDSGYFTSSFYFTGSDDFELYRTGSITKLSSGSGYWNNSGSIF